MQRLKKDDFIGKPMVSLPHTFNTFRAFTITLRVVILLASLIALQGCETTTKEVSAIRVEQKRIDSLWSIEISDSLKAATPYFIRSFASTQSGQTITLDNLKIENWPESILTFHDILFTPDARPIGAQDAVLGHGESGSSRHYFDSNGRAISRTVDNWYYDDSLKLVVHDLKTEYYGTHGETLKTESQLEDDNGNKIKIQVSKARLDGNALPVCKTFREFISAHKIEL